MSNDFIISSMSAIITYTITYPIDIIKTNYQVLNYNNNKINSITRGKNIYIKNGVFGFYKGMSSTLLSYPLFWGIFFNVNNYLKKQITKENNQMILNNFIPVISSSIASLITNPLFIVKTRFQTNIISNLELNYIKTIINIYNNEGYKGFYKGFPSTIMNNTKLWIQFPLYEYIKDNTKNTFYSAIGSKFISSMIFYPLDLIRINQRYSQNKISIIGATKNIYKLYGISGFYNGLLLYNLLSSNNFILLLIIKDFLENQPI
jgi:solute carrier family 25 folate transporter 32